MSIPDSQRICNDLTMLERRLRRVLSDGLVVVPEDLFYIHALALRISEEFHVKHVAAEGTDHVGNLT